MHRGRMLLPARPAEQRAGRRPGLLV